MDNHLKGHSNLNYHLGGAGIQTLPTHSIFELFLQFFFCLKAGSNVSTNSIDYGIAIISMKNIRFYILVAPNFPMSPISISQIEAVTTKA